MRKKYFIISVLCVIFISLNQRAAITLMGSISKEIISTFSLSATSFGVLNAMPLFCFFTFSLLSPIIARNKGILLALLLLIFGLLLRSFLNLYFLFIGTFLIGVAMAVLNVLMPVFIKNNFQKRQGAIMALYSMFLTISGLLGIYGYVLLDFGGLRLSLSIWVVFALLALLSYFAFVKNNRFFRKKKIKNLKNYFLMFKNLNAWKITAFMGFQACIYYTFVAWFSVFSMQFISKNDALNALVLFQIVAIISGYFLPLLFDFLRHKNLFLFCAFSLNIIASILMIFSSKYLFLVAVLFALPCGGASGVVFLMISQKTKSTEDAVYLNSISQGFGYLIASFGPMIFGFLKDLSEDYFSSCVFMLFLSIFLLISSLTSNKIRFI